MQTVRLIDDAPAAGSWNMAVDEAILRSVAEEAIPTLRFYRWKVPTLSLGYFQRYADRELHPTSLECACVRRASGGGAILHDRELTYSFVVPVSDSRAASATDWFPIFHNALISALSDSQIISQMAGTIAFEGTEPFLCFQRRHEFDVVLSDFKICGSAQRRHRGAILQHGSVILQQSPFAPELPGIENLANRPISDQALATAFQQALLNRLDWNLIPAEVSHNEVKCANSIESEKFGAESWTEKR